MCGAVEGEKVHHVHHLVPFRDYPSHVEANRLENLVTLCPACHQRAEAAVRMRSGLAGLNYALHHLAPLFLMCDQRDLDSYGDPQSPLGEGNPTVVIYERMPAGIGLTQSLYQQHREIIEQCMQMVRDCECADGCPACVGPAGEKGVGGKCETLALLEMLNVVRGE